MSKVAAPLHGLRVLDMSRVLAGPWAGQLLADLGAEVIKIEHPDGGDDTRRWGPPFVPDRDGRDTATAAYFMAANRGKKSVAVDFATSAGAAAVSRLAAGSDVLIENFRLGTLARHGLDFATLGQQNPRLVYCSITGFGLTGPLRERPGYDLLIQALGGLMSITGPGADSAASEPCKVGVAIADLFAGLYAVVAIQAALHERERSGAGQQIDISLYDVQVAMLANQAANYLIGGIVPERMGSAHPNIAPYAAYPTADGHLVIAVGNDKQFAALAAALGEPDLARDARFRSNADRVRNRTDLDLELNRRLRPATTDDWIVRIGAAVPCGPVADLAAVLDGPQVRARGLRRRFDYGGAPVDLVANPIRFGRSLSNADLAPPELGADNDTYL